MSITLSAAPLDPISAGLSLGATVVTFIAQLQAEANSPDAVKAAQARATLAQWDALATAQTNNDIETERAFLARRMAEIRGK